jgi:glutamate--cysteine ligase
MNYKKQVEAIINYLQASEKHESHFLHGAELEYFIVDKTTKKSIPYQNGIDLILKKVLPFGFKPVSEEVNIIGLYNNKLAVSLEPGGQWEISLHPQTQMSDLKNNFLAFLSILNPILASENVMLYSSGYLPASKIAEIDLLPKQRYRYMYEYFKKTGKYAHNMMKGTASIQVAVDYSDEEDFVKKLRLASRLTPIFSAIYDNSNVFEGKPYHDFCLRTKIWNDCDNQRCGIIPQIFETDFGYQKYAEYILNLVPIIMVENQQEFPTQKPFKDIFDLNNNIESQLNHIFSMCFPDVRVRKYIELRMTDSLPYPLSFAFIELVDFIFNEQTIFQQVYDLFQHISYSEINQVKAEIIKKGIAANYAGKTILTHFKKIMQLVENNGIYQIWNRKIAKTAFIPRFMKSKEHLDEPRNI